MLEKESRFTVKREAAIALTRRRGRRLQINSFYSRKTMPHVSWMRRARTGTRHAAVNRAGASESFGTNSRELWRATVAPQFGPPIGVLPNSCKFLRARTAVVTATATATTPPWHV